MVQRFALFVASLVAVAVLVVGMVAAGVGQSATGTATIASAADSTDAAATPRVQIDTVYVAPPQVPQTVVIHKTAPASAGSENESEGAGD
jgi:hypothetical protein